MKFLSPVFSYGLIIVSLFIGSLLPTQWALAEVEDSLTPITSYSDAQIAEILRADNASEISAGQVGVQNALNVAVKAFAKKMVEEHSASLEKEKSLLGRHSIAFEHSPKSEELEQASDAKLTQLRLIFGKEFDRSYMRSEVERHQSLQADLRAMYIFQARNTELKSYLQETLEKSKADLDEAKQILSQL